MGHLQLENMPIFQKGYYAVFGCSMSNGIGVGRVSKILAALRPGLLGRGARLVPRNTLLP